MSGLSDSIFTKGSNLYKKAGYLNLYGVDLIITLVICVFFSLIMMYYSVINNLQPIKADWDNNKCKPSIIPFAGIINRPDNETAFEFTQKNFIYCGQTMLKKIVDGAFLPIYLLFEGVSYFLKACVLQLSIIYSQISNAQGRAGGIFAIIRRAVKIMLIPLQQLIINVKDIFNKLQAIFVVMLYGLMGPLFTLLGALDLLQDVIVMAIIALIATSVALFAAAAAFYASFFLSPLGIPLTVLGGAAVVASIALGIICGLLLICVSEVKDAADQCFDPDTKVKTHSGELVAMKDLELNTILKNGTRVTSVMKLNNTDENGNIINKMYEINNGESNSCIYVTGNHLVYDPMIKEFVAVNNLRGANPSHISKKECPVLACLITTNHTIPIGEWIFHDWEDNNGSSSKSVE